VTVRRYLFDREREAMTLRTFGTVIATVLFFTTAPLLSATADTGSARKVKVKLTVPATVVEGDAFTVTAKVSRTEGAKQVQLQRAVTGSGWELVAKVKARARKTYTFPTSAGPEDLVRYRVKVLMHEGRAVTSGPVQTTVWHWTPMTDFGTYSQTSGVDFGNNVHITLSGVTYRGGWETYGKNATWESRITPGRNCRAFRGLLGVSDSSDDGSSAVISLAADDTPVYQSPSLTPGTVTPVQLDLALPFRLAIRAQRTSNPSLSVSPAIATPELLCTGLG
jgi:hypothetical protein